MYTFKVSETAWNIECHMQSYYVAPLETGHRLMAQFHTQRLVRGSRYEINLTNASARGYDYLEHQKAESLFERHDVARID